MKIILVVLVLIVGGLAAVGFLADPKQDARTTITIDAPVEKVFALVADPTRTKEWLPKDIGEIESTEVKAKGVAEKAAGALLDAAMGGGTNNGKNAPTHIHHFKGGKKLALQVTELKPNQAYMERVVETDMGMEKIFSEIEWGFEMQKSAADPKKTDLTVVMKSEATKPLGNAMCHVMRLFHPPRKDAEVLAGCVEAAARK
ncbi:MAG TPA: SRPBCC family protein [Planctomycetota bacterium]|nr:SRPBCC family protein [Planctomycetota bacterium]